MKQFATTVLILFSTSSFATPKFAPNYFEWKVCSTSSDCKLVSAAPPCRCAPDSVNTKFLKEYKVELEKIEIYWRGAN